jgi:CRISPR/Cas system-associated endoribonuclease Cas2
MNENWNIVTHILCTIIGAVSTYIVCGYRHKLEVRMSDHYQSSGFNASKNTGLSEKTKQTIKKIEIDSRTVVVNDMDNNYTKLFDDLGGESIHKDNIMDAVNKLSQLKNNGG